MAEEMGRNHWPLIIILEEKKLKNSKIFWHFK